MGPTPATIGERPLVLSPRDLAEIEAVPLSERHLPASTYELVAHTATAHPDRTALHLLGEDSRPWRDAPRWTYRTLLERVHQAANAYLALGLPEGGVVALMLPNLGVTYAALLGAQAVGIANPVNPMLAEEHLVDILTITGAQVLVAPGPGLSAHLWDKAQRVAARLPGLIAVAAVGSPPVSSPVPTVDFTAMTAEQPADRLVTTVRRGGDDIAAHFHTGGTTGTPKIAPHTHACQVYMAWALGCSGAYLDNAVTLSGLPLFHVNAVHVTGLGPFMHATAVVSLGPSGYRDKGLMADFWQIIERYRVTGFSGVPTVFSSLPPIPDGVDLSSLRAGTVGAAPLPSRVRERFEATAKVPLLEGYGLTEATCASAITPACAPRPGSVGLRLPYQHIKTVTVDADENPTEDCPPGATGVLAISGPAVFPGYLRPSPGGPRPEPTGKIFDGWLITGDIGHVDTDGYVYLTGRAKDLIIRGGHNIDPRPVEESLLAHPDVMAAAVVGAPDPHAGEVPLAYLVLRPEATTDIEELRDWATAHAPEPTAAPRSIHVVDALPTTAVGKIYKPGLVLDAVTRIIQTVLELHHLHGQVDARLRDGRTHATIHLATPGNASIAALVADLDAYAWSYEIVREPTR
ncbi:acyl-CoA synthetase [Frankia sp. CNm7]|uniref:Acyl-CoA synthetase n=1 Tax=Frankia nepalensis TaxID=1836974 RepID=A0A937RU74_9ACTN|nr:acyl-CoA synthetase [Frankia nepalensis]MBL7501961.1 acyl-CoA synthetase [Frankia nepalensis]MBL7510591.1 acyl-CoA synthetase [Frankia nepalensis]MBL7517331.1 acyl-CoA synthetase [Frankia nepalensis]MBL7633414.1 acyl-CoA synthetase [Frankia nepalensis]